MTPNKPFTSRPAKPDVVRMDDGRIGIFVGSAYQFTDDTGARTMRDKLDAVLAGNAERDHFNQADRNFCAQLTRELEQIQCGGEASPADSTKGQHA